MRKRGKERNRGMRKWEMRYSSGKLIGEEALCLTSKLLHCRSASPNPKNQEKTNFQPINLG